jgi:two-component system phosphate regulon response regulator PhoB
MAKILLVEDDKSLGETLCERLVAEGYDVVLCKSEKEAEKALKLGGFRLAILDIGLPDGSGLSVARTIKLTSSIPFMFLTAMNSADSRLEAFEIGADEYVPKPFHLREFLLRVNKVLEKYKISGELATANVKLDIAAQTINFADGRQERPNPREFNLLRLLISNAPRIVTRDEIRATVWPDESVENSRTIDNTVVKIRNLLGEKYRDSIKSIRGVGYQWLD